MQLQMPHSHTSKDGTGARNIVGCIPESHSNWWDGRHSAISPVCKVFPQRRQIQSFGLRVVGDQGAIPLLTEVWVVRVCCIALHWKFDGCTSGRRSSTLKVFFCPVPNRFPVEEGVCWVDMSEGSDNEIRDVKLVRLPLALALMIDHRKHDILGN
jgi:hypothetical protein